MARQIAPGTPTEIKAQQFDVKTPDWSMFEKMGDEKIKAANANFKLYAEALITTESQKIFNQFKDDPINLSNALGKLPEMLKGLPQDIQNEMTKKLYLNGISLVSKAQANQEAREAYEAKMNAMKVAENTGNTISKDYFNLLTYMTAPDEEKREADVEIYAINRANLADMSELKDAKGEYVFTEKQRGMMKMPSGAILDGFNSYVAQKSLSELEQWENNKFNNKKEFVNDTGIDDDTYTAMQKSIEFYKNVKKREIIKEHNQERIGNSLSFMDNPVIYKANFQRADGSIFNIDPETDEEFEISKKLEEQANQIYSLSDKVGDGKVDPLTLQMISRQVASITVDDENTSVVDNNILKAFEADMALRKAGADRDQLATFHKLTQLAMTDTGFKQSVAALANKPRFDDTMFLRKASRSMGILRPQSEDDKAFVENKGREAYFGAMQLMIEGNPAEALAFYDSKVQEAYDFIKKDIIDVEYVKNALANQGYAMVELNGNISKITGRLPNGEYIIEETGETLNGGI